MFGLGFWEVALVAVVALLVLGPEKLPKLARQLGKGVRELRRAATDFQSALSAEVDELEDVKQAGRDIKDDLRKMTNVEALPDPTREVKNAVMGAVKAPEVAPTSSEDSPTDDADDGSRDA